MPIQARGKVAMSSSRLPRATLGRTRAGLPAASTPYGKDVLCQVDSYGYDGHGLPLPMKQALDERLHFPSWHFDAVLRKYALRLGREVPFIR